MTALTRPGILEQRGVVNDGGDRLAALLDVSDGAVRLLHRQVDEATIVVDVPSDRSGPGEEAEVGVSERAAERVLEPRWRRIVAQLGD